MKLYKFTDIYCKSAGVVIPFKSKKDIEPNSDKLIKILNNYFDEFVRPIVGKAFYDLETGVFPIEVVFREGSDLDKNTQIRELIFKKIFEKEIGWLNPSEKLITYLNENGITEDIYGRNIDFAILDLYEKEFEEMVAPV